MIAPGNPAHGPPQPNGPHALRDAGRSAFHVADNHAPSTTTATSNVATSAADHHGGSRITRRAPT